jgi:beta-glucosidase
LRQSGTHRSFWTRYGEDFQRVRGLGLNAFRLGIEWSRIQPSYKEGKAPPPPFDMKALEHYARMLAACRAQGLEPVLTLHHFTHPAWLGTDPWLDPETPELFEKYVATSMEYLNGSLVAAGHDPVRVIITINEPNMLVFNSYMGMQFPCKAPPGLQSINLRDERADCGGMCGCITTCMTYTHCADGSAGGNIQQLLQRLILAG